MNTFVKHILKIVLILVMSAYALDFFYTNVYFTSKERNKIQTVINGPKKSLDVLILGSSRANNHIVTSKFNKKNSTAFNFGMSGSSLEESALLLQLILEKNWNIKNVLLEIDLNVKSEGFSDGTRASFMPYLRDEVISSYYKKSINFKQLYYFPFYRYIVYETKIGFREMFFSLLKRKSNSLNNLGFNPLNGTGKNLNYDLSKYKPLPNKNYNFITELCKKNNVNLIVITTPICKNTKNRNYFKKLKQFYPEVHNFEDLVTDDKYFSPCGHMNKEGAEIFTEKIINYFKNNNLFH